MKRILNIGCGKDNYGTDFVDVYPSRKEVIKCDLDKKKLPYKDNDFDEVYSAFNFEHLKNPNLVLKEMVRVLKKGGILVVKTDNAGWWGYHNAKSKAKVHYGGYHFENHGSEDKHYALYTFHHLENHFKELELEVIYSKIYQKDKHWFMMTLINNILNKTRFKWMAYPHIEIIGRKL